VYAREYYEKAALVLWDCEIPFLVERMWGEDPKPDWLVVEQDKVADRLASMNEARNELDVRLKPITGTSLDEINWNKGTEAYYRSQGRLS